MEATPSGNVKLVGKVVAGDGRGYDLGFPTANVALVDESQMPSDGVYACWTWLPCGRRYGGTASVGNNPTFPGVRQRSLEVYIHDYSGCLYGAVVRVELVQYLHAMVPFGEVRELLAHTRRLVQRSRIILEHSGGDFCTDG